MAVGKGGVAAAAARLGVPAAAAGGQRMVETAGARERE